MIIQSITFNLDINTRIKVIEDLWYNNTQIYICTEYASIDINILNIMYMIQFKIPDFIVLPKLF